MVLSVIIIIDELKYHYIAHTSLDVIEERGQYLSSTILVFIGLNVVSANSGTKSTECYLGLLYAMEDVAVYGYMTPLRVKIVLALALSDSVVKDAEIIMVCRPIQCSLSITFILY